MAGQRRIRADAEPVWAHRLGSHGFPLDAVFLAPGDFVPDDVPVADSLLEGSGGQGDHEAPAGGDGSGTPQSPAGSGSSVEPAPDLRGRTLDEVNDYLDAHPEHVAAVLAAEADTANGGRNRAGVVKGRHARGGQ